MNETLEKLGLILWKNWLTQRRRPVKLLVDILIPVFVGAFLLYLRYAANVESFDNVTTFQPFSPEYIPPYKPYELSSNESDQSLPRHLIQQWDTPDTRNIFRSSIGAYNITELSNKLNFLRKFNLSKDKILKENDDNSKWTVIWSPRNRELNKVMDRALTKMEVKGINVNDSYELEDCITKPIIFNEPKKHILAGIVFPDNIKEDDEIPFHMKIKIRFPSETRTSVVSEGSMLPKHWMSSAVFPMFQVPGPREPFDPYGGKPSYYAEGFLGIEDAISSSLIDYHMAAKNLNGKFDIKLSRFPYPKYTVDPLLIALQNFLPFLIVLSFLFSVNHLVSIITTEKEKRLTEVMKIMGMSDSLRWTSWYLYSMLFLALLITILTLAFKIPFLNEGPIFPNSDWTCIWIFFICYTSGAVMFCFVVSSIFNKANIASIVSGMAWFLLFVPFSVIQPKYAEVDTVVKLFSCLSLNTAMGFGSQIILMYEGAGSGIQWNKMFTPASPDDGMTMAYVLFFMLFDSFLYLCLALYIENVFPGELGIPLPWYYPFQRSYWFGDQEAMKGQMENNSNKALDYVWEEGPKDTNIGIQITNLRKIYKGSDKAAVKNLNLNVYEGQITVLMGFNGAGKTTTLSILTGMFPPSSGTAVVGGYDICTNMREARKSLGFCPQYNVLFDELSVEEHIYFFGRLKGLNREEIKLETTKYLAMLNLSDKRRTFSKYLSGGMKRKLSVALALCGNTKVLLLDEPTAGMDPKARRSLWDILIAEKKGRSILLTTHFLDEADLLGDRVAIMSAGQLCCNGSTFFLKKNFSSGYHLIMVKKDDCNVMKVSELIGQYIPENLRFQDIGMELSYQLPEKYSAKFQILLNAIENKKDELRILSYGISPTTLEDVFMRISENVTNDQEKIVNTEEHSFSTDDDNNTSSQKNFKVKISDHYRVTGVDLILNQVSAIFYKHLKITLRSWKSYLVLILIAVIGIGNAVLTLQAQNALISLPPRDLDLHNFPKGLVAMKNEENCNSDICKKIVDNYKNTFESQDLTVLDVSPKVDMENFLIKKGEEDIYGYRNQLMLGTTFSSTTNDGVKITGWFNAQPYHIPPAALSYIYNSVLKAYVDTNASLLFTNEPLDFSEESKVSIQASGLGSGFQISIFVSFSFIFVSSFHIMFPIQERENKAKLLQFVSGVNLFIFWLVAFVWNMFSSIGPNIAVIISLAVFQEEGFSSPEELAYCFFILVSFFVSMLPLVFLLSLLFTKPSLGFIQMTLFGGVTGIFATILVSIFQLPVLNLQDLGKILDWVFSFFPLYSMGHSLQNINIASVRLKMCEPLYEQCLKDENYINICCKVPKQCPSEKCVSWTDTFLDWDIPGIGRYISALYVVSAISFTLLFIVENGALKILRHSFRSNKESKEVDDNDNIDSDVIAESHKVANISEGQRQKYNLLIDGLTKSFGNHKAVKKLHLAVEQGECFGLLGANGAGKTTTFRMLTGDEYPSSGNAYVQGKSIKHQLKRAYQRIGYCPQFDALFNDLTGREHLRIYCLIRGIPKSDIDGVSIKLANELMFSKFLDKKVGEYSGGNKRKLSTALALIGNPPVVYLDEPTAGMDPVAKRHLWAIISKIRSEGTTVILTSHSMEECEALCTRLTVMVKGQFKCLGSTQYLKNKFCQGYSLTIKTKKDVSKNGENMRTRESCSAFADQEDTDGYSERIRRFINENFPGAVQNEEHDELLVFIIPQGNLTWSKMFGLIESVKDELHIEDYSLGQTTLEQILLMFTNKDDPAVE